MTDKLYMWEVKYLVNNTGFFMANVLGFIPAVGPFRKTYTYFFPETNPLGLEQCINHLFCIRSEIFLRFGMIALAPFNVETSSLKFTEHYKGRGRHWIQQNCCRSALQGWAAKKQISRVLCMPCTKWQLSSAPDPPAMREHCRWGMAIALIFFSCHLLGLWGRR